MCLSAVCCVGKEVCSAICSCFKCCCKMTFKQEVRLGHIVMNLSFFLFAIFVLHYVQSAFDYFSSFIHCPSQAGGSLDCLGVSSVYRISFALALLYAVILLAVWTRSECSKLFNEGLWMLKILGVAAIFIGFMYVDYEFFNGYRDFARVFGALFLIIQSVMLIDIFYLWGENWKKQFDQGAQYMAGVLIGTSVVLYGLCITLIVMNYVWFSGCGLNTFINVANTLIVVAITVIQVLGFNPHGSLITTGAMALYLTFLVFSAQLSSENECNNVINEDGVFTMEMSFGFLLLAIVLLYLTFSSKQTTPKRIILSQNLDMNGVLLADTELEADKKKKKEEGDGEGDSDDEEQNKVQLKKEQQQVAAQNKQLSPEELAYQKYENTDESLRPYIYSNTYIIFHIVMFTSSVYGCMLLTNWGAPDMNSTTFNMYQPSQSSYWIKIIVSWGASLLYIWTLVAPALFPNRDFS